MSEDKIMRGCYCGSPVVAWQLEDGLTIRVEHVTEPEAHLELSVEALSAPGMPVAEWLRTIHVGNVPMTNPGEEGTGMVSPIQYRFPIEPRDNGEEQ